DMRASPYHSAPSNRTYSSYALTDGAPYANFLERWNRAYGNRGHEGASFPRTSRHFACSAEQCWKGSGRSFRGAWGCVECGNIPRSGRGGRDVRASGWDRAPGAVEGTGVPRD